MALPLQGACSLLLQQAKLPQGCQVSKLALLSCSSRAGLGKADTKLREVILAEVLDTRPSVRWDDVAGLQKAKQVLLRLRARTKGLE